jgi:cytochrome c oxidase subunit IV
MSHLNYEEAKKVVFKGFVILGIVTIAEVMVALIGKGYIINGFHLPRYIMYILMITMSLYKAYFIVYEFMHMRYEAPGLVRSVLMPTLLLVWAVIAFFTEGNTWYHWRKKVNDRPISQFTHPAAPSHIHEMPPIVDTPIHTNKKMMPPEEEKKDTTTHSELHHE